MRVTYLAFALLIGIASCSGVTQRRKTIPSTDEAWVMSNRTISFNKYKANGLLDTSISISYMYIKGRLFDSSTTFMVRKYDHHNNLVDEQEYDVRETIKKSNTRTVYSFDENNRKLTEIRQVGNFATDTLRYEYDVSGSNTVLTIIHKMTDIRSDGRVPVKPPIDTTISRFTYNKDGAVIKAVVTRPNGDTVDISCNLYSNGQKQSSYTIGKNGDAIAKSSYFKEYNYLKEVGENTTFGSMDTSWEINGKIYESISHHTKLKFKSRTTYKYDSKGNEVESISYN